MQEALKRVKDYIKKQRWNDYLVILPTFEIKDYFIRQLLAGGVEGMLYPNIYTFDEFIDEVLRREDISMRIISNIGRHELMRKILPQYSYGIAENILATVSELKKAGITAEELREISGDEDFSYLARMAEIYKKYDDELLKSGLEDAEDKYAKVFELLKKDKINMLKNLKYFYADWFFDLAGVQEDILKAVAEKAKECELYILPAGETDIAKFRENENWMSREENHISRYIFTSEHPLQVSPSTELFTAQGKEGEVRGAVRLVKEHFKKGGKIEDIAIVCRYPEKYAPILRRICDKADIPLALDVKRPLSTSLLVKNITSLLKLRSQMEESFLFSELDNLSFIFPSGLAEKIGKNTEIKLPLEELKENFKDRLDEDIEYFLNVLERLSLIPQNGTYQEIAEKVEELLQEIRLIENILCLSENLNLKERFAVAGRDLRALEKFNEILKQVKNADFSEDKKCTLSEFLSRLELYINNTFYVYSPGEPDGIKVLPPGDMRGLSFPVVIILGMDEGTFPLKPEGSWVIRDKERKLLWKKKKIYLPTSRNIYQREKILFYLALKAAEEKIILFYPFCDEEGEELLPSFFITALQNVLHHELTAEKSEPWLDYEESLAFLSGYYLEETADYLAKEGMSDEFISFIRQGESFKPQEEFVSEEALKHLAAKYRDADWTVSQLDSYIKCPLQYFFAYELKLEKKEETVDEVPALYLGRLQHEIMCSVFTWWKEKNYPVLDEKEVREKVREELDKSKPEEKIHPTIWEIEKEKLAERLTSLIMSEIERGKFRPHHMEWKFRFELEEKEQEPVKLSGIIDRIDIYRDDKAAYAIYDYKNSGGSIPGKKAALDLASLQLPLYIMAVEKKFGEVAGAGYINLKGAGITAFPRAGWRKELLGEKSKTEVIPEELWQNWLNSAQKKTFEVKEEIIRGSFPSLPHPAWSRACEYCAFVSICFYR
ncbi:PD-(D/E)XK nuclease family protein [Thermosyntropha sp.]|uniref:PD-(D/E)XK nuclease family protein n=1 Tax=Thermosyntropha sp. TaxID=2740820 RepID=UPI0025EC6779|nr:PD-(D/E)XK nuclease family protein [Thermosyntropha sp.]MBO8159599.1 exodeoxyribonuclease V subunit gamma [Thermosyntropha sp.]